MPLASIWTLCGIDTQGADLRLTNIAPWGGAGHLVPVDVQSSFAPIEGDLADLITGAGECFFAAQDVRAPGFAIAFAFAEPVSLRGFRFAGPDPKAWPQAHAVIADGLACSQKAVVWVGPGVLSPEPTRDLPVGKYVETWVATRGGANHRQIDASADGRVQIAAVSSSNIAFSLDGGVTWSSATAAGTGYWLGAGVSGDGSTLAAAINGGYIWISRDSGTTWSQATAAGSRNWQRLAINYDGLVIFAVSGSNGAYLSKDGGVTWSALSALGSRPWLDCDMSSDGQVLFAAPNGSTPMLSIDGGDSWRAVMGTASYQSCAVSDDGNTLMLGGTGMSLSIDGGSSWRKPPEIASGTGASCRAQSAVGSRNWSQALVVASGALAAATSSSGMVMQYVFQDSVYVPAPVQSRQEMQAQIASGNVIAQSLEDVQLSCSLLGFDAENGGNGVVYGTVELYNPAANALLKRRVRLHRSRDGLLVREAWSDAQGNYRFEGLSERYTYDVIAWDHEGQHRSVVANDLRPEVMP